MAVSLMGSILLRGLCLPSYPGEGRDAPREETRICSYSLDFHLIIYIYIKKMPTIVCVQHSHLDSVSPTTALVASATLSPYLLEPQTLSSSLTQRAKLCVFLSSCDEADFQHFVLSSRILQWPSTAAAQGTPPWTCTTHLKTTAEWVHFSRSVCYMRREEEFRWFGSFWSTFSVPSLMIGQIRQSSCSVYL